MQTQVWTQKIVRTACIGLFGFALTSASSMSALAQAAPLTCVATPSADTSVSSSAVVSTPTEAAIASQGPIPTEDNPPGDIPDNQAFVTYTSTVGGYSVVMPEGWARKEDGANVTFSDKLHSFVVETQCASAQPTVESAQSTDIPWLEQHEPGFTLVDVKAVDLPAGPAVLIQYQTNSAPDEVTGKQIRLDVDRYELFNKGTLAAISLRVPAGSDNVDVSNIVSLSFQWTS